MRARNIKPAFFTNELLGTYEPIMQLLFAGLWCLADRDGILEDRPLRIKAELFPYRDITDISRYLTVMERDGFLIRYEVDGLKLIEICNFKKHQSPHNTEKSKGYPKHQQIQGSHCNQTLTPLSNGEITVTERPDSLIPDSLIPDSLIDNTPANAVAVLSKKPKFNLMDSVPDLDQQVAADFLAVRKSKRAPMTATALALIKSEADKAGITTAQAIAIAAGRGWQSFKAEWIADNKQQTNQQQDNFINKHTDRSWRDEWFVEKYQDKSWADGI